MMKFFENLRYSQIENLIVLKEGKIIHHAKGTKNNVEVDIEILRKNSDLILIHNHPEGGTFSLADIINIIEFDIKEMILITKNYVFRIFRPIAGWSIDKDSLIQMIEYADRVANSSIALELQKENIDIIAANTEKSHYIWTIIFQLLDVNYTRKKYSDFIKQSNF